MSGVIGRHVWQGVLEARCLAMPRWTSFRVPVMIDVLGSDLMWVCLMAERYVYCLGGHVEEG